MLSMQATSKYQLTTEQCQSARMAKDPRFDGVFFVLVKTTGIFCRPVCKVRAPLEKNVAYAFSAIEAVHKGYRPCLRCRPDSAPSSYAWLGVETTVKRACHLLEDFPEQNIETIAQRMGISSRYLSKLFSEYLHISPKQYRLYHQLLRAKYLLHQTTCSVEEVALTVGFNSARQLQTNSKKVFGLSPSKIRQSLPNTQISNASKQIQIFLSYRPPYDWVALRDFFALREIQGNEIITSNGITKVLTIQDQSVRVEMVHDGANNGFCVNVNAENSRFIPMIIKAVQTMLDLHATPLIIDQAMRKSGLPAENSVPGIRIPGIVNRYEAACRAVLGQQVSIKAAITQLNRLHEHLSEQGEFPSPSAVANSELSFLKMPERRKQALRDLSMLLHNTPDADWDEWLAIKGIGPWTCEYVNMRTHASTDIFLGTDLVVKQQLKKLNEQNVFIDDTQAAPWRSYLTYNIWSQA